MSNSIDKTNMYTMLDHWLNEIAPKYFDLKDLNLNRVGLFGYVNEIMAHNQESIMNENSILYNELFFKRAVLPQSIYAYASHYLVDDTGARPAKMGFAIGINEDDLLRKTVKEGTETFFIIDTGTEIILEGNITYTIDYAIKISVKKDDFGKYVYSAKYMTEGLDNPISRIKDTSNPFLKSTKISYGRTNYIFIYLEASQLSIIEKNKVIYSDDFIEYFSFDIECDTSDGQIADFSVFYKEPDSEKFIQIEKKLVDSAATENPFCYYQFKDHNRVNISFSTIARFFRPKFNSELKFVFYNTLGAKGMFEYTGDNVSINLKSNKYDYRDILMIGKSISNSVDGRDRKSYEDIKQAVSINASVCKNIGTEIDLNKHFSYIEGTSDILFVKKRDDIIDRLYGAFLLLEDPDKNIIPTNTVDLELYNEDFDLIESSTKRYILKSGNKFVYKPASRTLVTRKVNPNSIILSEPKFEYTNPFTIVINRSPFFVEYYLTSINSSFIPDFTEVNDATMVNFIINKIDIQRNSLMSDEYVLTMRTIPNSERTDIIFAIFDKDYNFISANDDLVLKGVLFNNDEKVSHRFDFKMIDADFNSKECVFEARLKTDDYISVYSSLRMTGNMVDIDRLDILEPLIPATELKFGFLTFMKEPVPKASKYHDSIPGMSDYSLTNVYRIPDKVDLINNLNKLMYSTVQYKYTTDNKLLYSIKECPFVRYDYLMQPKYALSFIKNFLSNYITLKENLKFLTNAYNLSLKLYNTYGKSYYLYINEKKTNTLDKVNLSIYFRIKLNPNRIMDEAMKEEIRLFIKSYVESVNDDINLYISNLIKALENEFRDILYINFDRINEYGSEVQSIEKNFPGSDLSEKNRLKDFVPEYININKIFEDTVKYDVVVTFV